MMALTKPYKRSPLAHFSGSAAYGTTGILARWQRAGRLLSKKDEPSLTVAASQGNIMWSADHRKNPNQPFMLNNFLSDGPGVTLVTDSMEWGKKRAKRRNFTDEVEVPIYEDTQNQAMI